jgi:hypothetical protein
MNERNAWAIGIVALVAIAGGLYYVRNYMNEEPEPKAAPPTQNAAPEEPKIKNPVPTAETTEPEQKPLPPLAESDAPLKEALTGPASKDAVSRFLVPDGIVRRFVATIDNLPRKKVAMQVRPVSSTPGAFITAGEEDDLTLNPENYARYAPFVKAVEATDSKQLAQVYLRFYPLFQESYEGLGYPNRYFNDRVVEVIDHLLATPDVKGPIKLTQPHVFYEFADPRLEALSAGQKALVRMGSENAAVIKKKLEEVRREIAKSPAG